MATSSAIADLASAFIDQPKTLAYGLVRGAGNLVLQYEIPATKNRISFFVLGEGPWDSILRLWINRKLVTLPNTALAHFHQGLDGEIGFGMGASSTGPDQHVDSFFASLPGGYSVVTLSRYAYLALNVPPDPGAPSANLEVLADYQAMKCRIFDASGNQTSFAWTQNPAWWICDFLIRKFVLREAKVNQPLVAAELARFDWASFAAAAAYYDTVIGFVVSDNFNRANGGPGANWTAQTGGFTIASNTIGCSSVAASTRAMMYWNAASFANDQFSQITVTTKSAGTSRTIGVAVRCSTSAETYYAFYNNSTTAYLFKVIAGTTTVISQVANVPVNGDVLRLEVSGTTLTAKLNGTTLLSGTDSSIASGSPGVQAIIVATTDPFADDWSGGNLAAGAGVPRFSDGGLVFLDGTLTADRVLEQMLLFCRSYMLERNGKLSLYPDQTRALVFTFTSDNVAPNTFTAKKTNLRPGKNQIKASWREVSRASGSTDDATRFAIAANTFDHEAHQRAVGVRGPGLALMHKVQTLQLDYGNNTAERVARLALFQLVRQLGDDADANLVYNGPFSAEWTGYEDSLAVECGDVVTIDKSLSEEFGGQLFEVLQTEEAPDGTRKFSGLAYQANAFPDVAPTQQAIEAPTGPGTGLNPAASLVDSNGNLLVPIDTGVADGTSYLRIPQFSEAEAVDNGNFDVGSGSVIPGWLPSNAALLIDTTTTPTTGHSLKVTTSVQFGGALSVRRYRVTPGEVYKIAGYTKSDGTGSPDIQLQFLDGSGAYLGGVQYFGGTSTSFTFGSAILAVPANATQAFLSLQNQTAAGAGICWFKGITVTKVLSLNDEVNDGTTRFARTGVHSSYRPLTNPIAGHDAGGSVGTIPLANFTMRVGATDVSITGSTIGSLLNGTLYFVYYDDSTLAGGAVTFAASTTRETALQGPGRFFVGSVLTPKAGSPDTVGNNDGGTGAQIGAHYSRFATVATGAGTAHSGAGAATDGDWTTEEQWGTTPLINPSGTFKLSGFGSSFDNFYPKNISLVFKARGTGLLPSNANALTTVTTEVAYSINGGSSSTTVRSVTGTGPSGQALLILGTDVIALPNGTPPASVQVMVKISVAGSLAGANNDGFNFFGIYEGSLTFDT